MNSFGLSGIHRPVQFSNSSSMFRRLSRSSSNAYCRNEVNRSKSLYCCASSAMFRSKITIFSIGSFEKGLEKGDDDRERMSVRG